MMCIIHRGLGSWWMVRITCAPCLLGKRCRPPHSRTLRSVGLSFCLSNSLFVWTTRNFGFLQPTPPEAQGSGVEFFLGPPPEASGSGVEDPSGCLVRYPPVAMCTGVDRPINHLVSRAKNRRVPQCGCSKYSLGCGLPPRGPYYNYYNQNPGADAQAPLGRRGCWGFNVGLRGVFGGFFSHPGGLSFGFCPPLGWGLEFRPPPPNPH